MSSPIRRKKSVTAATTDEPDWHNPCGWVKTTVDPQTKTDAETDLLQLLGQITAIKTNVAHAMAEANEFRENYVQTTFDLQFWHHHRTHRKQKKYDEWLYAGDARVPKELGETVAAHHLNAITVNTINQEALKIFKYLQRFAIAFELIIQDHHDSNTEFKDLFRTTRRSLLRKVACEIYALIEPATLETFEHATREGMPLNLKHPHETDRNIRDWIIFRDYMILLEYIHEIMHHLQQQVEKSITESA